MANEATPIEQAMADALDPTGAVHHMNSPCCGLPCLKTLQTGPLDGQLSQKFFAELAASIITPHVGDVYRDTIRSVLHRATEAGLYQPEPK